MTTQKESPLSGDAEQGANGLIPDDKYSNFASIDQQRVFLAHKGEIPWPPAFKERSERFNLAQALEVVNDEGLDGVCLYTGEGIYSDGNRLVIISIYTNEQIEALPFDLPRRVPTYIERTNFGYQAFYWFPDSWTAKYYDAAHLWLDSGTDVEILFGRDRSTKSFIPLTFDIVGEPHSIASPDETVLDDSLGELLKDQEKLADSPVQETKVPFPKPFPGPMAAAVDAALKAEYAIQPELTTLAVLIGMAAACGSCYVLPGGGRLNLYGCGVAETGDGKDRPRKLAVLLARQAIAQVIGKPASGQALEDVLCSRIGMLCEVDELGHMLAAVNGSRAPAYLIELGGMVLKLFSASDSFYAPRAKAGMKAAPPVIDHPALSLLGYTTEGVLAHAVTVDDVENGLLGRFLFVRGEKSPPTRRKADSLALPESVKAAAQRVSLAVKCGVLGLHDNVPITVTPEADALLDELHQECHRRRKAGASSFAKALYARSYEKAERIMGVLAVWDNPAEPVITPEHIAWAAAAVRASDAAVLHFAERHMHSGRVQDHAAQVRQLLTRFLTGDLKVKDTPSETAAIDQGWVPRSALLRRASTRGIDTRQLEDALRHLEDMAEIERGRLPTKHANGREECLEVVRLREE